MTPADIRNVYGARAVKVVLAKDQPQYTPLPCLYVPEHGYVLTEWELTAEELAALLNGGRVRLYTYTFGQAFQPIHVEAVTAEDAMPVDTGGDA